MNDYFLKIDGIEGESHNAKHEGEIELESFSWSEEQSGRPTGGGGGAGRVSMGDFVFSMRTNLASLPLLLAVATGQHVKSAMLTATTASKSDQTYLIYKFTDVQLSSYRTETSADDRRPVDHVSFNFGAIQVEYRPQQPDGSLGSTVRVGWDLKGNHSL